MKFLIRNIFVLFIFYTTNSLGQSSVSIEEIKVAFKAGNSKELSKYFHNSIELGFNNENSSYNKSQAELIMKNFFQKNPPLEFELKHQGSSGEGLKYFICSYSSNESNYTALIRMKPIAGKNLIHKIEFSKE